MPGEVSHVMALKSLNLAYLMNIKLLPKRTKRRGVKNIRVLGLSLENRLGLAAGLDKNGDYIDSLSALGFGFIELGTVTPRPQQGNPKPRLFRIKSELALVNSLGFNNKGVDYLVERVTKRSSKTPLGISIGKNFDTPNEEAISDYLICLEKVFQHSSYVAINISSPNTNNLRDLETLDFFDDLSSSLKEKQKILALKYGYRPLLFKISPDIDKNSLISLSKSVLDNEIDGIICSNTSVKHNHFSGKGGISGGPLLKNSTQVLKNLRSLVGPDLPIIASGGVMSYEAFKQKLDCGADLVQIYTGMIYKGTNLIKEILDNKK